MDNHNSNSFIMALVPVASTIAYMAREPHFSWIACIPYILPSLIPLLMFLPNLDAIQQVFRKATCLSRKGSKLDFTARIRLSAWISEPDALIRNFSTVLWEWNRTNKTVNCKNLMEESMHRRYWNDDDDMIVSQQQPIFVDDASVAFWNEDRPNIHYTMWVDRNTDREGNNLSELFLKITFLGDYKPKDVVDHIDMIRKEALRINESKQKKQRVLVSTESKEDRGLGPNFMIYEFATTSSFQNFFSDEATLVRADLDHFLNKKSDYLRTGRPWTYTVLNEGPPGVGKTKLVKAIAQLTGYTLIVINLAHIPNMETLYDAFHSSVLAGDKVPHEKRLYYIPEVDTQMFDMLKSRDSSSLKRNTFITSKEKEADTESRLSKEDGDMVMVKVAAKPDLKKPTLGEILNVLDGVPERHGHILVMDTNHLSELDPALVRPGRVDRIVSWGKMSALATRSYLENYYETVLPATTRLPDKKYTAAELQALVSSCPTLKEFMYHLGRTKGYKGKI